jgi:hypothetical protein
MVLNVGPIEKRQFKTMPIFLLQHFSSPYVLLTAEQARSQKFAAGGRLDPWGADIWVNNVTFSDDFFSELPQVQLGGKLGQLGQGAKPPTPLATGLLLKHID